MTETTLSPFDLLDLPRLQREIVIYLSREGPTGADTLAQALGRDPSEVRDALSALVEKGHVRLSAHGQARVVFGRTRRRTLPAQLWPALLAPSRLYSKQEIATLRTAVPILQFARAKIGEEDQRQGKQSAFNVVVDGRPMMVEVRLGYPSERGGEQRHQAASGPVPAFSSLRYATFQLPTTPATELKVWVHTIIPAGDSKSLPALLEVHRGSESVQARAEQFDLRSSGGQIVLPFSGEACRLQIMLSA